MTSRVTDGGRPALASCIERATWGVLAVVKRVIIRLTERSIGLRVGLEHRRCLQTCPGDREERLLVCRVLHGEENVCQEGWLEVGTAINSLLLVFWFFQKCFSQNHFKFGSCLIRPTICFPGTPIDLILVS